MSSIISSDKVKGRHFYSTKHFIDDLCAINDSGELEIFLKELELSSILGGSCYVCELGYNHQGGDLYM